MMLLVDVMGMDMSVNSVSMFKGVYYYAYILTLPRVGVHLRDISANVPTFYRGICSLATSPKQPFE